MTRSDPIGVRYYRPLQNNEIVVSVLFYATALLSISALLIDKNENSSIYDAVQIAFILCVIISASSNLVSRFYLGPRAATSRRSDLLSNSFSVALTHETSTGFYNNSGEKPFRRLGASTLESSLFTSSVLRYMLSIERLHVFFYLLIWSLAALIRNTDLSLLAIIAQIIFGEQTLSKWVRMEWLRSKSEVVYAKLHGIFTSSTSADSPEIQAQILEQYSEYEIAKATAGIQLTSRIFEKHNEELSAEWERIRHDLKL